MHNSQNVSSTDLRPSFVMRLICCSSHRSFFNRTGRRCCVQPGSGYSLMKHDKHVGTHQKHDGDLNVLLTLARVGCVG